MIHHINFRDIFKIIFIGTIVGILSFITQDNVKWSALFRQPPQPRQIPEVTNPIETIGLADALKLFNSKKAVFLDVRDKKYFDYGSIQNSESLSPADSRKINQQILERWKSKQAVIVYCNGITCPIAFYVAHNLSDLGLESVKVYAGGWPEWRGCRLPMTMSLTMQEEEATREK
jgi:3-mercaptopyruvate sulfurtransferase SseA